ncbi:hypothetical protein CTheo_5490 [Ceratobasidium theobromae]|uniref:Uncharacterized protein n=1 Tax=Ceratobasidium theobromae TaxID=1582974 RepID=A0A5N5QHX0_9AGAM|nr:hypothetical protein CTheo_5490 [Ceratobasidium theobromae]
MSKIRAVPSAGTRLDRLGNKQVEAQEYTDNLYYATALAEVFGLVVPVRKRQVISSCRVDKQPVEIPAMVPLAISRQTVPDPIASAYCLLPATGLSINTNHVRYVSSYRRAQSTQLAHRCAHCGRYDEGVSVSKTCSLASLKSNKIVPRLKFAPFGASKALKPVQPYFLAHPQPRLSLAVQVITPGHAALRCTVVLIMSGTSGRNETSFEIKLGSMVGSGGSMIGPGHVQNDPRLERRKTTGSSQYTVDPLESFILGTKLRGLDRLSTYRYIYVFIGHRDERDEMSNARLGLILGPALSANHRP